MAMRKRVRIARRKPIEEAEIIVIPMIDVMMFLLFFFMVASLALVVQAGLPVNLPKASTADQHRAEPVTVTIMRDNRIYFLSGSHLVVPGPRLVQGAEAFARVLHPELFRGDTRPGR